jgi:hypothetical protein
MNRPLQQNELILQTDEPGGESVLQSFSSEIPVSDIVNYLSNNLLHEEIQKVLKDNNKMNFLFLCTIRFSVLQAKVENYQFRNF